MLIGPRIDAAATPQRDDEHFVTILGKGEQFQPVIAPQGELVAPVETDRDVVCAELLEPALGHPAAFGIESVMHPHRAVEQRGQVISEREILGPPALDHVRDGRADGFQRRREGLEPVELDRILPDIDDDAFAIAVRHGLQQRPLGIVKAALAGRPANFRSIKVGRDIVRRILVAADCGRLGPGGSRFIKPVEALLAVIAELDDMVELVGRRGPHQGVYRRFLAHADKIIVDHEDGARRRGLVDVGRIDIVEHDLHRIGDTHRPVSISDIGTVAAIIVTNGLGPADPGHLDVEHFLQRFTDRLRIGGRGRINAFERVVNAEILGLDHQFRPAQRDPVLQQQLERIDHRGVDMRELQNELATAFATAIALQFERVAAGLRRGEGNRRVQRSVATIIIEGDRITVGSDQTQDGIEITAGRVGHREQGLPRGQVDLEGVLALAIVDGTDMPRKRLTFDGGEVKGHVRIRIEGQGQHQIARATPAICADFNEETSGRVGLEDKL